jgi:uncharacterized UBP type Zn finger protein
MTGDNKFFYINCNKKNDAIAKTLLYELPKYLIIHTAINTIKINDLHFKISFWELIDFSPFLYYSQPLLL